MASTGRKRDIPRLIFYAHIKSRLRRELPTPPTMKIDGEKVTLPLHPIAVAVHEQLLKLPHAKYLFGEAELLNVDRACLLLHRFHSNPEAPVGLEVKASKLLKDLGFTAEDRRTIGICYIDKEGRSAHDNRTLPVELAELALNAPKAKKTKTEAKKPTRSFRR